MTRAAGSTARSTKCSTTGSTPGSTAERTSGAEARSEGEPSGTLLLRGALAANAVFSGLSGLVLLAAAGPAGEWLGVPEPWVLRILGAGLLAFAASLAVMARAPAPGRGQVLAVSASDFAWVLGSVVLLAGFGDLLTVAGRWAVGAVAVVVAALGALQLAGLRRAGRG